MPPSFRRVLSEGLGVATGDTVTTSYHTGPYEVLRVLGPEPIRPDPYFLDTAPTRRKANVAAGITVIHLICCDAGDEPTNDGQLSYLNDLYRDAEGRLVNQLGDVVTVTKPAPDSPAARRPVQMALL